MKRHSTETHMLCGNIGQDCDRASSVMKYLRITNKQTKNK